MYKKAQKINNSSIRVNDTKEGETIEKKIQRMVNNNEPIRDGATLNYTEEQDGVMAGYDIRTDKFEVAVDAMDRMHKASKKEKSDFVKGLEKKNEELNKDKGEEKKGGDSATD